MKDIKWIAETNDNISNSDTIEQKSSITTESNHIYFYNGVNQDTILELNKVLQQQTIRLLNSSREHRFRDPELYLHINSGGGSVFSGLAAADTILKLRKEIKIITVVEGITSSSATFISIVGSKRQIRKHAYMLIHQLSTGMWGKYRELKDESKNIEEIMRIIKELYSEYTKVDPKKLDEILDHDIFWNPEKCLEEGLVDEII